MCGIVGAMYFDRARAVEEAHLRAMADRIVHRGPDDHGYHVDGNVGIGMRRLSIIDLSGGHQPMFSPDRSKAIVYNGELYNFRDERAELEKRGRAFETRSDTEVVLAAYETYGDDFLSRLNGMFGLAVHDRARGTLTLARDRLGIKPLYYLVDDEKLVFASEIKAVLAFPGVQATLDPEGLAAFLRYGFTPPPYTLFKGVRKLPSASILTATGRDVRVREYWRPTYRDKHQGELGEVAEGLYALLADAVDLQMVADVPLGAFLSGGMDSSGIVHLMREAGAERISTYSIGFGATHAMHSELPEARRFAEDYKTDHHEIVVEPDMAELFPRLLTALDEPVADSSFLVTYLVSRLARESVTVILSGVGGDELFGGYRRYLNTRLNRYVEWIPRPLRANVIAPLARRLPADRNSRLLNSLRLARAFLGHADLAPVDQYREYTTVFSPDATHALLGAQGEIPDYHRRLYEECDSADPLDQVMYFDLRMSLPEQLLMLTDKMTMATSLEARVPYLDHRVVEYAARIPSEMKIRGATLREVQRRALRGRLPSYVFDRRKRGFGAPVGAWVRNDLAEMVGDLLGPTRLRHQGLFDAPTVERMLADHQAMRADYSDQILALLGFQLWSEHYLGAGGPTM